VLDEFEVLIPISVVKPNAGQSGLNMLAFGNVGASKQDRHIGHFIVSIILMSYTLFLIWREYNHFIEIRQAWLSSPQHVSLARTRTIAISNIPTDVNSGSGIKELAGTVGRLTGTSASRPSNVTDSVAPEGDFDGVRSVRGSRAGSANCRSSVIRMSERARPLRSRVSVRGDACCLVSADEFSRDT